MNKVTFSCPSCGQRYNVEAANAGRTFGCKKCGAQVTVPGANSAAPDANSAAATRSSVDMGGGTQVLRREGTVFGAAPVGTATPPGARRGTAPVGRPITRVGMAPPPPPAGRSTGRVAPPPIAQPGMVAPPPMARPGVAGRGATGRVAPGRAAAPVAQGTNPNDPYAPGAKPKNKLPLILGISGGGVALVVVVVLIIVLASSSDSGKSGGNPKANPNAPDPVAEQKKKEERDRKKQQNMLEGVKDSLKNVAFTSDYSRLWDQYKLVRSAEQFPLLPDLEPERKPLLKQLAAKLGAAATGDVSAATHRAIAEALVKDGYRDDAIAIAEVVCVKESERPDYQPETSTPVTAADGTKKYVTKVNEDFKALARLCGIVAYEVPAVIQEAHYPLVFKEYDELLVAIREKSFKYPKGYFPPKDVDDLKKIEASVKARMDAVEDQHKKDGFARFAARAFASFRIKYRNSKEFPGGPDDWTYSYSDPFVYYIELKDNTRSPEQIKQGLEEKAIILRDVKKYFEENCKKPWGLKRLYPDVADERERESWPLEIVVFKDGDRYQKFGQEVMGGALPPGARAHYSPTTRQIITWDDPKALTDKATMWSDIATLAHEAWHFLSGIHIPDPNQQKKFQPDPESEKTQSFPSYSSLLIQEGLTDFVSGFETADSKSYQFGKLNYLRLRDLQFYMRELTNYWKRQTNDKRIPPGAAKWEEGKLLSPYSVRDIVQAYHYGMCNYLVANNLARNGASRDVIGLLLGNPGWSIGLYYAEACMLTYFFHNADGGKYKSKFLEWCRQDYLQEIDHNNFDMDKHQREVFKNSPGMVSFQQVFGIGSYDDAKWEEITQEYRAYVSKLEYKDVGKGYETGQIAIDDKDGFGDAHERSVLPARPDSPGGASNGVRERFAVSRRED